MTAIRGYVPATNRSGLGVHSLDHFVLAVPDLAPAQRFYSDFGLDVQAAGDALGLRTAGHDQRWGMVVEGKRKKLHHLSFGCYSDDLPYLQERAEANGVELRRSAQGFREQRLLVSRSGRPAGRDQGRGQGVAGAQDARHLVVVAGRRGGRAGAGQGADRASAPAVARAGVHPRRGSLARVLFEHRGPAALRPFRPRRLHARHPRQRPSHPGVRAIARARAAPLQLGHERHRRHRARRHAHGGQGLQPRAGVSAGTCSAPTTSTTSAIPGAATRSTRATSTTSRPRSTGRPAATRRKNSFYLWGPSRRPTSRSTASSNHVLPELESAPRQRRSIPHKGEGSNRIRGACTTCSPMVSTAPCRVRTHHVAHERKRRRCHEAGHPRHDHVRRRRRRRRAMRSTGCASPSTAPRTARPSCATRTPIARNSA